MMRLKYEHNCYVNPAGESASLGPRYMLAPSRVSLVIFLSIKALSHSLKTMMSKHSIKTVFVEQFIAFYIQI